MKIAEISERYGLSLDTLRYYERVGLIPSGITTNWIYDESNSLST